MNFFCVLCLCITSVIQCELTSVSRLCRKSKAQLLPAGDEWSQSAVHQDVGLQHHPDHQRSAALSRREIRASASPVSDKSTNVQSFHTYSTNICGSDFRIVCLHIRATFQIPTKSKSKQKFWPKWKNMETHFYHFVVNTCKKHQIC